MNSGFWNKESERSKISIEKKYLLYYSLKDNHKLIEKTEQLAKFLNLDIIIIHPTGIRQPIQGKQIYGVGPYEFLYLIKNAEIVSTNSFHASAFSVLFRKRYFHIKDTSKETRVESLLTRLEAYKDCVQKIGDYNLLDLSLLNSDIMESAIENSRRFLSTSILGNTAE